MSRTFQKNKKRRRKHIVCVKKINNEPIIYQNSNVINKINFLKKKKNDNEKIDIKTHKRVSTEQKTIFNKTKLKKENKIDIKKVFRKENKPNIDNNKKTYPSIINFEHLITNKNYDDVVNKNKIKNKKDNKKNTTNKTSNHNKIILKERDILNIKKEESMNNTNKEIAVSFKNIIFSYDGTTKTLDDISFDIYHNEYVCILGHNGSGKSTISKVLIGLLKPINGDIKIYNQSINYESLKYLRDTVGIIFQNPDSQFIGLTAEDDIAFGLENKKVDPESMKKIIQNVSSIIDIKDLLEKDSLSLSGGQKQRVAIASVLASNPRVMIFDESTSMLDPRSKKELKETILKLKHNADKTIISITHDMDEVLNADKVIVMEKGKVKKIGKPSEIFIDEKQLKELALDLPFSLKLSHSLKGNNLISKNAISVDEIVELICEK